MWYREGGVIRVSAKYRRGPVGNCDSIGLPGEGSDRHGRRGKTYSGVERALYITVKASYHALRNGNANSHDIIQCLRPVCTRRCKTTPYRGVGCERHAIGRANDRLSVTFVDTRSVRKQRLHCQQTRQMHRPNGVGQCRRHAWSVGVGRRPANARRRPVHSKRTRQSCAREPRLQPGGAPLQLAPHRVG